ncbi:hypothetical protein Lal_00033885 [Lupinus albus]|nr:hypothetical protein Lal_00033885 [Lupinus albus]
MGNEFRCIGGIRIYRRFNFRAYPNCWFSLCVAIGGIGMVIILEYLDNKKNIETIMNSIEFPLRSRFDFDRYGLVPRSSPRQAKLILIAGTVTMKMAPSLVRLYEQMPTPKYVNAMGACTITGGMFSTDSYSTVRGIDKLIYVDVYLSSCPPKSEAVIDAITKLHKRISREIYEEQIRSQRENKNRCFTTNHKFHVGRSTHTIN